MQTCVHYIVEGKNVNLLLYKNKGIRIQVCFYSLSILLLLNCGKEKSNIQYSGENSQKIGSSESGFVGRDKCMECHQREYQLWKGSDHDMAMDVATEETVLGDFNNVEFTHFGITSTFYEREGKFWVNTEGPDGQLHDYEIKFVFGIRPLQQYLIEFPGGRYQMLPLCWDTRPFSQGGQRWFHIYPSERISPDDELYWANMNQNWNYMCAECHSTNLKKNYDIEKETYQTSWSEIDVSCEACHGPGHDHIEWAKLMEAGQRTDNYQNMGLVVRLKDPAKGTWVFNQKTGNAYRTTPPQNTIQIEVCARCHSRRMIFSEDYQYGLLMNTHRVQLLSENYYFADGQILEEVYVYGSFLQSKMYHRGVVCSDCHEPHSGKIYAQGNALCYRCHHYEKFGTRSHHFHHPDSSGASCVECHMPERTYMVVDPRRDHSIRIPRPDLSMKIESPNACNKCHSDKAVKWAADYMIKWYGRKIVERPHFGEVIYAAREELPFADQGLIHLAGDTAEPAIVRATALEMLERYSDPAIGQVIFSALQDKNPLVRFGALTAMGVYNPNDRFSLAKHLLTDPVKMVRLEAARLLSEVSLSALSSSERALLNRSINEYIEAQLYNGDRAGSHLNLGMIYYRQGHLDKAEVSFKKAIKLEPYFPYAYINLADLYRAQGRDEEGEMVLRDALRHNPEAPNIYQALGFLYVRLNKNEEALRYFQKAVELHPDDAHLNYLYAIGLNSSGKTDSAIAILEETLASHPVNRDLLFALTTISRDKGDFKRALKYADKLVTYWPNEQAFQHLREEIRSMIKDL
jgi:tetratricopeptide (TPR) repeat protein